MIQSTRLAKAAYWLAGELSQIKTYQRVWESDDPSWLVSEPGEPLPELKMVPAGRIWLPCRLSMKMLGWSCDLDTKHWDHWALEHSRCKEGLPCPDCGGHIDPPQEDEW